MMPFVRDFPLLIRERGWRGVSPAGKQGTKLVTRGGAAVISVNILYQPNYHLFTSSLNISNLFFYTRQPCYSHWSDSHVYLLQHCRDENINLLTIIDLFCHHKVAITGRDRTSAMLCGDWHWLGWGYDGKTDLFNWSIPTAVQYTTMK